MRQKEWIYAFAWNRKEKKCIYIVGDISISTTACWVRVYGVVMHKCAFTKIISVWVREVILWTIFLSLSLSFSFPLDWIDGHWAMQYSKFFNFTKVLLSSIIVIISAANIIVSCNRSNVDELHNGCIEYKQ